MKNDAQYITLTEENFQGEVLESTKPVLVDFWATWCGPCHWIAPVIEEVAADFQGRAKVGKMDVNDNLSLAMRYSVRAGCTHTALSNPIQEWEMVGPIVAPS